MTEHGRDHVDRGDSSGAALDAYRLTEAQTFARFGTSREGLGAEDVVLRRAEHGDNVIVHVTSESLLRRYARQFRDWMIVLLLGCAAITAYLGDTLTSAVLVLLVLLNTSIGFFQEYRSGRKSGGQQAAQDRI